MRSVVNAHDGHADNDVDGDDPQDLIARGPPGLAEPLAVKEQERQLGPQNTENSAAGPGRKLHDAAPEQADHVAKKASAEVDGCKASRPIADFDLPSNRVEGEAIKENVGDADVHKHCREQPPQLAREDQGTIRGAKTDQDGRIGRAARQLLEHEDDQDDGQQRVSQPGLGHRRAPRARGSALRAQAVLEFVKAIRAEVTGRGGANTLVADGTCAARTAQLGLAVRVAIADGVRRRG